MEPPLDLTLITVGVRQRVTRGSKNPLWFGLADRLRKTRERAGLSGAAADQLARAGFWLIENERQIPLISTVEKIAASLGVPPCWLAFGSDGEAPFRQKILRTDEAVPPPAPEPGERLSPGTCEGVGDRLRVARQAAGMSMRELARRAELSVNAVSLIEAGRGTPRVDNCEALAVALDVAPCWLAYGVGRGPIAN
jgi:transcriptional regulator with XRE-family HTH domain